MAKRSRSTTTSTTTAVPKELPRLKPSECVTHTRPWIQGGENSDLVKHHTSLWAYVVDRDKRNWVVMIDKIQYTNPITYKIKDLEGEKILGSFYQPKFLLAKQVVC